MDEFPSEKDDSWQPSSFDDLKKSKCSPNFFFNHKTWDVHWMMKHCICACTVPSLMPIRRKLIDTVVNNENYSFYFCSACFNIDDLYPQTIRKNVILQQINSHFVYFPLFPPYMQYSQAGKGSIPQFRSNFLFPS